MVIDSLSFDATGQKATSVKKDGNRTHLLGGLASDALGVGLILCGQVIPGALLIATGSGFIVNGLPENLKTTQTEIKNKSVGSRIDHQN